VNIHKVGEINPPKVDKMRSRAFTLVELLVVISVVAVLMAFLMPALARARQQGKTIVCLNNLRQMAIASQVYISNNDGSYPIAYAYQYAYPMFISYAWDFTTTENWDTLEQKVIPGLLWAGETIEKIQQCPSFNGSSNWLEDPYTGYNYNTSYIGHGQLESVLTSAKVEMIRRPSRCALFGDGQWAAGADKFMRAPWPNEGDVSFSGRYAGTQGYRHQGKTNVAYCDNHAATVSECYKNTDDADVANIATGTGFLSPDNSAYSLE
jgi:prepilin-type N-terminal cleavage/methylation domain-containing protein/prepilin-type processing-associated H-X9-DG protein